MTGLSFLRRAEQSSAAVVVVLLLVAALGARGLNADTYWYDEWWSLYNAGGGHEAARSLADIVVKVAQEDPIHPPAYYVLLSGWGALVGWSEAAVRSLSLFAGILAVAVVYRVTHELMLRRAGFYAALALGSSAFFVSYLHEARMYTLLALLGALALWLYWRAITTKVAPGILIALYLTLVGLLYTHYIAGLFALSIGLYHLIIAPKDERWLRTLLIIGAAGLTFVPWLNTALGVASSVAVDPSRQFVSQDALTGFSSLLYLFSNGSVALLAIFAVYALPSGRRRSAGGWLVWLTAVSTLVLALIANERVHYLSNTRYLIVVFAPLALIVGMGAARTKLAPLMMTIWVAAGLWISLNPGYFVNAWVTVLPWDTLADDLRARVQPGDPLVYLLPDGTPGWMHDPLARYYLRDVPVEPHLVESLPEETPEQYDTQLAVLDDARHFWVAFDPAHRHSALAESAVQRYTGAEYRACEPAVHRADTTLQLYARATDVALDYQFGDGIALGMIEALPEGVDSSLRLLLLATVDPAVTRGSYSVALHVEDAAGQLVAQTDFGLPDGCYAAQIDGLPPGAYRALVTVYDWQTGERLPGVNTATGEQADRLPVGAFAAG